MRHLYTTLGRHNLTLGESAPHDASPANLVLELDSALHDDLPSVVCLNF